MNYKKYIPYIYFTAAVFIMIGACQAYSQDLEEYRIIFSFKTQNVYYYLGFRGLFALLMLVAGIQMVRKNGKS